MTIGNRAPSKRLLSGGLVLSFAAAMASAQPTVTNYEAAGNLAATTTIGCVSLKQVRRSDTPADLLAGMSKCFDAGRRAEAVDLFILAGVYGRYDTYRVADKSAHQAISVLQAKVFDGRSEEDRQSFFAQIRPIADNPKLLGALCRRIERVGAPTYFPTYMIQHGMGAFTGKKGDALVAGFNSKTAYAKAMESYLNCKVKVR